MTQLPRQSDARAPQDQDVVAPVVRSFRESDAEGLLALSGPSREALGRPESLWVAELNGTLVGMVSVAPAGSYVARILNLSVDPQWRETTLLTRLLNVALCHCRRSGVLKVLLNAEQAPTAVLEILRGCGFQFSRQRQANGDNLLEFYANLYASPKCEKTNDIPRQALIPGTPTMQALLYHYGFDSIFAREKLLQLARPIVGRRVLDIGTGAGWMAAILAQNGFSVVSIDIDPGALALAERQVAQVQAGSVRFVQADASILPFASGAFNAVFSFESIHHLSDCQRTVHEMLRVCAPGGVVAIADLNDRGFYAVRAVNLQAGRPHQENNCRSADVARALVGQGYQPARYALEFVTVFVVRKPAVGRRTSPP